MAKAVLCVLAATGTLVVLSIQGHFLFGWLFGPQLPSNQSLVGFAMASLFFSPLPVSTLVLAVRFRRDVRPLVYHSTFWPAATSLLGTAWVGLSYGAAWLATLGEPLR